MKSIILAAALGCPVLLVQGPPGAPGSRDLEHPPALRPISREAFGPAEARHLLARSGFGGTPAEALALAALGPEAAVDRLLARQAQSSLPPFTPRAGVWPERSALARMPKEEREKALQTARREDREQLQELQSWWLRRMVLTDNPLEERLTLFWHGHFATSYREVRRSLPFHRQNETFRRFALGNFKELVRAMVHDPALLAYLNNNRNRKGRPNENLARELLELFTLGVNQYSETDVKEAARALTGFTFEGDQFRFARGAHDRGPKQVLGKRGNLDGDDVVDAIFEQPAASRFIVRKLLAELWAPSRPAEVVEALASEFRAGNFELKPLLRALFLAEGFYAPEVRGRHVKSPVELVAGTLRALGIDPGNHGGFTAAAARMGQELFFPPNVKGWDGGTSWIASASLFERYNFARLVTSAPPPVEESRPGNKGARKGIRKGAPAPLPALTPRSARELFLEGKPLEDDVALVLQRVTERILAAPPGAESQKRLAESYRSGSGPSRLTDLIQLVLATPEYQLD